MKTALVVTIFSCVERFIGFLYRIFLARSLDAELIGIYQVTLSVIGVLVTLSASGIPITVSRLMIKERESGNIRGENDVVSAGILSSLILSLPITLILYFFKNQFSFIFADPRCYDLFLIILPGVVITSVYAVIRGYFWGNQNFFTYSLIELLEEVVMCLSGVIIITLSKNAWQKTLGAGQSVLISYIFSFILSTATFILKSGKITNPLLKLKPLMKSSSPITLMRTLTSFLGSIVAIILPNKLVANGLSQNLSMKLFGELSGMAMPLLFIPSTVIGSIALVIVPKLSQSYYRKDSKNLNFAILKSVDYSLIISCLIVPIFIACGNEIGQIIYKNQNAGHYLSVSAFIMVPMSLTLISNSILNSLNREKFTLINFILGAVCMIFSVMFLTKFVGVYSLIIGYLISYVLTSLLNFIMLSKTTHQGKIYLKKTAIYTLIVAVTTLLGFFMHGILFGRVSNFIMVLILGVLLSAFSCVFIFVCGIFDFKKIFTN